MLGECQGADVLLYQDRVVLSSHRDATISTIFSLFLPFTSIPIGPNYDDPAQPPGFSGHRPGAGQHYRWNLGKSGSRPYTLSLLILQLFFVTH